MNYVAAASTIDFAPGTMKAVEAAGQKILLAHVDGTYLAIQRKCPHMGADLCKGTLEGHVVTCRMHGARFDLTTGKPVEKAKLLFLKMQPKDAATYPVKVEGTQVLIGV